MNAPESVRGYLCLCSQQLLLSDLTLSPSPLQVEDAVSASVVVIVVFVVVVVVVVVVVTLVVGVVTVVGVELDVTYLLSGHCHCLSNPSIMMFSMLFICSLRLLMSYSLCW